MTLSLLFGEKAASSDFDGAAYIKWLNKQHTEEKPRPPLKPGDPVRASQVGWMCPREEVLAYRLDVTRSKTSDGSDSWVMGLGTSIHYTLQNEILGPVGELVGTWRCLGCGHEQVESIMPTGRHCQKWEGDGPGWFYVEVKFHLDPGGLNITGHIDGLHPGGDIWEFKSASSHAMQNIRQGIIYPAYLDQVHIYMEAADATQARFMFVDKGGWGLKSMFPLMVKRDENTWASVRRRVEQLREGLNGGALPTRLCGTHDCARAKACPVAGSCFALPA